MGANFTLQTGFIGLILFLLF